MAKVFIGVDPHKLSATIEVVDDRETVLATGRFATDKAGYAAMRKARGVLPGAGVGGRGQQRRRPAAGAAAAGRRGARGGRAGEAVGPGADVRHRPQPQDRRPRRARGRGGRGPHHGLRVLSYDEQLEALRMLVDRRDELTRARIQTRQPAAPAARPNSFRDRRKKNITTAQAKRILATVRPRDLAGKTRRRLAAEQLAELVAVEKKIKALTRELKAMVTATGSTLMDLPGVGPVVAARILADVGDVARFADRNRFASWTGTAPIEASSGEIVRHRLSRAGNRRMNHMIHIAATTQTPPRHPRPGLLPAQARRRQDQGRSHALPQATDLRRPLPPAPRRRRAPPQRRMDTGPGGHRGASLHIQRGRLTPAHRHFGSATSRTRTHDATRADADTEDHAVETLETRLLTSEGCRRDAPPSTQSCRYAVIG